MKGDYSLISSRYLYFGLCSVLALGAPVLVEAKSLADLASTFEIEEESFLTMIQRRVEQARVDGKLEVLEEDVKKRVKERVMTPVPVQGLQKTQEERSWYFDPSITLDHDIRDHKSNLIHPKGTTLNPLSVLSWRHPMILIDGSDEEQVSWAVSQVKSGGKIVLTKGSPITLFRKTGQRFYFDQGGKITQRFQIKQIPARITQEGQKLLIEEVRGNS
jgi:conjugal transfer pilus assembly protein TraW